MYSSSFVEFRQQKGKKSKIMIRRVRTDSAEWRCFTGQLEPNSTQHQKTRSPAVARKADRTAYSVYSI